MALFGTPRIKKYQEILNFLARESKQCEDKLVGKFVGKAASELGEAIRRLKPGPADIKNKRI